MDILYQSSDNYSLLPQALGPRQVWDLTSAHAEEPTSRMYKTIFNANCLKAWLCFRKGLGC